MTRRKQDQRFTPSWRSHMSWLHAGWLFPCILSFDPHACVDVRHAPRWIKAPHATIWNSACFSFEISHLKFLLRVKTRAPCGPGVPALSVGKGEMTLRLQLYYLLKLMRQREGEHGRVGWTLPTLTHHAHSPTIEVQMSYRRSKYFNWRCSVVDLQLYARYKHHMLPSFHTTFVHSSIYSLQLNLCLNGLNFFLTLSSDFEAERCLITHRNGTFYARL